MPEPFEQLGHLDRLVHEPARLAILTALSACRRAEFMYLLRLTGLTRGNLSTHLAKLEEGGLVRVDKRFVDRKPNTEVSLTRRGAAAVEAHWRRLEELRVAAREWSDERGSIPPSLAEEPS
jgi:DNA-binding MarR family transcriptional regulator